MITAWEPHHWLVRIQSWQFPPCNSMWWSSMFVCAWMGGCRGVHAKKGCAWRFLSQGSSNRLAAHTKATISQLFAFKTDCQQQRKKKRAGISLFYVGTAFVFPCRPWQEGGKCLNQKVGWPSHIASSISGTVPRNNNAPEKMCFQHLKCQILLNHHHWKRDTGIT